MSESQEENQGEKGFRMIKCKNEKCKKTKTRIKIQISKKDYGKKIIIRCPKCKTRYGVNIPFPPKTNTKDSSIEKE